MSRSVNNPLIEIDPSRAGCERVSATQYTNAMLKQQQEVAETASVRRCVRDYKRRMLGRRWYRNINGRLQGDE